MKKITFCFLSAFLLFGSLPAWAGETAALPKDSLYAVAGAWKNQDGKDSPLKSFSGKPVILSMTYTGCQYSCPMTIQKLTDIEKALKKKGIRNYHIVIASFDADRDKPEALKAYMAKKKMNESQWTFLSPASDGDVRELAVLLNMNYQKVEGGDFSHSNEITLLDSQGRIVMQLKGLNSDHKDFVEKLSSYEK